MVSSRFCFSFHRFCSKQLLPAPRHLCLAQQVWHSLPSQCPKLCPSLISSISYWSKRPIFLHRFQIGYDRRVRPNYGGSPVTVGVSLYVLSLSEISEKFMDFTFDMYFRYDGLSIVENIKKNPFFCQAILERWQIEIWSQGKNLWRSSKYEQTEIGWNWKLNLSFWAPSQSLVLC